MKKLLIFLLFTVFVLGMLRAQETPGSIVVKLDPALDGIVAPDAKLEKLFSGQGTFEGPTWVGHGKSGFLIFSDIPGGVMNKLGPDDKVSVFLDHIFTRGDVSLLLANPGGTTRNLGSNGITLDREGRILFCNTGDRTVERIEKDGKRTILASGFEGKKFNLPNDLVVKSDGAIYFTDSRIDTTRADNDPEKGEPFSGVYLIKNGKLQLLVHDLTTPNGLAFTVDEKRLYVIEGMAKLIDIYDVQPDDTIVNRKLFIDMNSDKTPGGPDGMRLDEQGNVYSTGPGGVWILSPEGKHIGTILAPGRLTNLTFGGPDRKTLYVTSFMSLYRIQLKAVGLRP
jgi:gluconolactonase